MKSRVEVVKNSDGRIESGVLYVGNRKKLSFVNNWDDSGFLADVIFDGKASDLPTSFEQLWYLNEKFIERIRRIDLIDEITLINTITQILSILKITNIETISSLPALTVLGDLGAAFGQTAPVAAAYFSPTGIEAPFVGWTDVDDAHDGILGTCTQNVIGGMSWTNFLILTFAATVCDKVRLYIGVLSTVTHIVDIDVYQSGWIHVYEGSFDTFAWQEYGFSPGSATKVRVRFKNESITPFTVDLFEVQPRAAATGSILKANVTASVLPTGAATEATLTDVHGHVNSIDGKITACNTGAIAGTVTANPTAITWATARIDTATGAANVEVVAAQGAGNKIYVVGYQLRGQGDAMVSLRSANTDLSPEWDFNAREGVVCPPIDWDALKKRCYFVTAANEALNYYSDAAIRVTGNVQYVVST